MFHVKSRISITQLSFLFVFRAKLICSVRNSKSIDIRIFNVGVTLTIHLDYNAGYVPINIY